MTDSLLFFTPKTHELIFKPCSVCRGNVQLRLIRNDDEIRRLLNDQKRKLKKLSDGILEAKEQELQEAKNGGRHMATNLLNDLKTATDSIERLNYDRNIAFKTVSELRKTRSYDELQRDYDRLNRSVHTMEKNAKDEIDQLKLETETLQANLKESNTTCDQLNTKINLLNETNRTHKSEIRDLKETLEGEQKRVSDRDLSLKTINKEKKEETRLKTIAENAIVTIRGEMDTAIEQLTKIIQKNTKTETRMKDKISHYELQMKQNKTKQAMKNISKSFKKWTLANARRGFSKWRKQAFANRSKESQHEEELRAQATTLLNNQQNMTCEDIRSRAVLNFNAIDAAKSRAERSTMLIEEQLSLSIRTTRNQQHNHELQLMRNEEVRNKAWLYYQELIPLRIEYIKKCESSIILQNELQMANDPKRIELHVESATIIQGYWRGYVARKTAANMSQEQKLLAMEAILTLTSHENEDVDRMTENMTDVEKRVVACSIIQRTFRTYSDRKEMKARALTRDQELKLKATAATMLAASFRGMKGRAGKAVLRKDREGK